VRAELHAFVRALSREDWEEAAACVRRGEDDPWGPDEIAKALAPLLEEEGPVRCDHLARLATNTTVRQTSPHQWTVRQVLRAGPDVEALADEDESGRASWSVEGRIDLRADTNPDGPLVEILAIGE
jgi:hypothetical protein